jgi:hypothetical protein
MKKIFKNKLNKKQINFIANTKEIELFGKSPTPSIKFIPDWYKDINPFSFGQKKLSFPLEHAMPNVTLKHCIPFLDALSSGYMATLTDDVFVEQTDSGPMLRWRSDASIITMHSPEQFDGFSIPDYYENFIHKWHNDWIINTPKGYSTYFTHPSNRFDLPFTTISGLVDTDNYTNTVHFPFMIKKGFEGIIPAGTPVAQLILIKRESWISIIKKYSKENSYKNYRNFFKTFVHSYKKNYWIKKSYE